LMEVYYALLRDGQPEEKAGTAIAAFQTDLVDFSFDDVREAMKLRLRWQKRRKRISYVDAIAYQMARKGRYLFLTGDTQFVRAEGVTYLRTGPPSG